MIKRVLFSALFFVLFASQAFSAITFTNGVWEETLADCTETFTASSNGQSLP